ncbi:MAG: hypothetical protein AB2815_03145 [Candidatus Sedimenticola endophacoides]
MEEGYEVIRNADAADAADAEAKVAFQAHYSAGDSNAGGGRSLSDHTADSIDFTGDLQVAANASGSSSASAGATAEFYAREISVNTGEQGIDVSANADGGGGIKDARQVIYGAQDASAKAKVVFSADTDTESWGYGGRADNYDATADRIDFTGELQVTANASGSSSADASALAEFYAREIIVETLGEGFDIKASADAGTDIEDGQEVVVGSADEADAEARVILGAHSTTYVTDVTDEYNLTAASIDFTGELQVAANANASGSGSASASASAEFYAREISVNTGEQGFDVSASADGGGGGSSDADLTINTDYEDGGEVALAWRLSVMADAADEASGSGTGDAYADLTVTAPLGVALGSATVSATADIGDAEAVLNLQADDGEVVTTGEGAITVDAASQRKAEARGELAGQGVALNGDLSLRADADGEGEYKNGGTGLQEAVYADIIASSTANRHGERSEGG